MAPAEQAPEPTNGQTADASPPTFEEMRAEIRQLGDLLKRRQFGERLWGRSYWSTGDGEYLRKLFTALGYKEELNTEDYWARYERGGIAKRIVEIYPRAAWSGGFELVEDPDPGVETEFETAARDLFSRLDAPARLMRADILRGLGSYSILLLGAPGEFSDELERIERPDQLIYLRPLSQKRATVKGKEEDPQNERFGLPLTYDVDFGGKVGKETVHWSRVIHLARGALESDWQGGEELQPIWNYLDDLDKIVGGGAESSWRRASPLTLFDLDPSAEYTPAQRDALQAELEDVLHDLKPFAKTRGITPHRLSETVQGFGGNADAVEKLIAATHGTPQRILFGSEMGQLASSQDRGNWNDNVAGYRGEHAEPVLMTFVWRLIEIGALPEPAQPWEVVWPEREELDEKEKAEVVDKLASANERQVRAGADPVVATNEIRLRVLGMGPIEEVEQPRREASQIPRSTRETLRGAKLRLQEQRRTVADTADKDADSAEWRAVHRAADEHREGLARFLAATWREAAESLDLAELRSRLGQSNAEGSEAVALAAVEGAALSQAERLPDRLLAVLNDGALAALRAVRGRGSWFRGASQFRAAFEASFDTENERAREWAEQRSSELITETTPATRAAVRELIARAFSEGLPPQVLAKQIQQVIGLRSDQVRTLERFRESLQAEGLAAAEIEKRVAKRSAKLLRQRAQLIARTEVMRASNEGQRQLWLQAQDRGDVPRDQRRQWIATPDDRVRPEHLERDGVTVGVAEGWPWGTEPGEEPHCRCAQALAPPEET